MKHPSTVFAGLTLAAALLLGSCSTDTGATAVTADGRDVRCDPLVPDGGRRRAELHGPRDRRGGPVPRPDRRRGPHAWPTGSRRAAAA